jgi:hypothetical protein
MIVEHSNFRLSQYRYHISSNPSLIKLSNYEKEDLIQLLMTPIILGIFMKFAWRNQGKQDYIKNKMPYYKDPLLFFPLLILSITIACIFFYLLLILFDKLFPAAGYSTMT